MSLSESDSFRFLECILKFPNWQEVLETDVTNFLKLYIRRFLCHVPFQNIDMAATDPENQKAPDVKDVIDACLSGSGGVCIHLNYFTRLVFESIGLEVISIHGFYPSDPIPNNHVATVVKVSSSELYLVDVGGALPGLKPVPLHALPWTDIAGGLPYVWRQTGKDTYSRFQLGGKLFNPSRDLPVYDEIRVSASLERKQFNDFHQPMTRVFTDPESLFLTTPLLFRYLDQTSNQTSSNTNNAEFDDSNLPFVYIWGRSLLEGNAHCRKLTTFKTYEEMFPVIQNYFPRLENECIQKALNLFKLKGLHHFPTGEF